MLSRIRRQTKPQPSEPISPTPPEREYTEMNPALRELYERIARGHTLNETEEQAQRKLHRG